MIKKRPLRAVVADDNEDQRELITFLLRREGFEVWEAADGEELLRLLTAADSSPPQAINLVVTDVMMPRCTGLVALEALHHLRLSIPVIVISAALDHDTRTRAAELGVRALVAKPFDTQQLRELFRKTAVA